MNIGHCFVSDYTRMAEIDVYSFLRVAVTIV